MSLGKWDGKVRLRRRQRRSDPSGGRPFGARLCCTSAKGPDLFCSRPPTRPLGQPSAGFLAPLESRCASPATKIPCRTTHMVFQQAPRWIRLVDHGRLSRSEAEPERSGDSPRANSRRQRLLHRKRVGRAKDHTMKPSFRRPFLPNHLSWGAAPGYDNEAPLALRARYEITPAICWSLRPSPALAFRSNSSLYSLKSALVPTKDPAHLCMSYFITGPKGAGPALHAHRGETGMERPEKPISLGATPSPFPKVGQSRRLTLLSLLSTEYDGEKFTVNGIRDRWERGGMG